MPKMVIALLLIIAGIIVIAFPLLGLIPISILSGFLILMLGIGLILAALAGMGKNKGLGLGLSLFILGIIALILGIGFIFNPLLFSWLFGFTVWIMGFLLIVTGIIRILSKGGDNRCGIKDITIGLLILLAGLFLATYTWLLGVLIGLWLISAGLRVIHNPNILKKWA
jgi:membrane protein HdeD